MSPNEIPQTRKPTRVGLLYFSGAGNTECLARIFERVLPEQGNCAVFFCERITRSLRPETLKDFDLLGIGTPVYFRRAPAIVFETIERLSVKGRRVFSFCTKGMYSGNVNREILRYCERLGATPAGSLEITLPGTDLLLFTKKNRLSERIVKRMRSRKIAAKVRRFVQSILDDPVSKLPRAKWYTFLDEKGIKPLERVITNDYRTFKGKYRVLLDRCTACLLCVQDCPENNITYSDGKIAFGDRCDTCLRCVHHCPTEAVQLGDKTLNAPRYWPKVTEDLEIVG